MANRAVRTKEPLTCPKCGSKLGIELVECKLEGRNERLFFVSCPKGDYRAAATEARVSQAIAEAMSRVFSILPA